jgi:hypothetical protein
MMQFQKNAGAARRFARMMKFAAWLQDIPNKITPPPFRLMQIGSAFWQSRALYVAARLDIATVLGDDILAADEIAGRVSAHPDATFRLLRMLAAMGVFKEHSPRRFSNNKLSNFLRTDNPRNVRAMTLMHNSEAMSRPWYEQFEQGVRSGGVPFELAHGEPLFGYMDTHAELDALFAAAMDAVETLVGDSFATDFDWGRFERVIDVGGSKGQIAGDPETLSTPEGDGGGSHPGHTRGRTLLGGAGGRGFARPPGVPGRGRARIGAGGDERQGHFPVECGFAWLR